jgi:hypothetical protein
MSNEIILCPKSKELVDESQCIAVKNMSKLMAEYFSVRVCKTVNDCPKEDYCSVFECGWQAAGFLLSETLKD